jgi:hypothetical protein
MPDTYLNPYVPDSPIGAALKNLSGVITKGPNEAQNVLRAEAALKLKQERENTGALGDVFRQYGTPAFDPASATDMAIRAGVSPANLGGYDRYNAATRYGAADPRTDNAAVGAGEAFGSTAGGFREGEANQTQRTQMGINEQRYQFDNKPTTIGTDRGPVIARQTDAYGQPAVEDLGKVKGDAARRQLNAPGGLAAADDTTQQFIGAAEKNGTPHNYVFQGKNLITNDGITDARTGQPLPAGGYLANAQGDATGVGLSSSVTSDLQKQDIQHQQFKNLVGFTRNLLGDPNNVGVLGYVKGGLQDANVLAGNLAQGLGYKGLQDAVGDMRQKAAASGIDPALLSGAFDPKLPALHTAYDLLVFSAASTLAGQSGRGVSDKDVKLIKGIVGDPNSLFANPQNLGSKLDTLESIADMNQGVVDQRLHGNSSPAVQAAPGGATPQVAPGAPQMQAPQADPLADARAAIARGADPMAVRDRLQKNGINPAGL